MYLFRNIALCDWTCLLYECLVNYALHETGIIKVLNYIEVREFKMCIEQRALIRRENDLGCSNIALHQRFLIKLMKI